MLDLAPKFSLLIECRNIDVSVAIDRSCSCWHAGCIPFRACSSLEGDNDVVNGRLAVEMGGFAGEIYRFDGPVEFVIGRASDCDIQVPDSCDFKDISLHHCALHMEPPRLWLSVYESNAGTFVNDLKISPTVGLLRLYDEDEVRLGRLRMSVHIVEHAAAESLQLAAVSGSRFELRQ